MPRAKNCQPLAQLTDEQVRIALSPKNQVCVTIELPQANYNLHQPSLLRDILKNARSLIRS